MPDSDLDGAESLAELTSLTEAAGAEVVGSIIQKRTRLNPACCVGSGKAEEIAQRAEILQADVVIFDNDLSPAQIRELEKIIDCKVLDRSELILDIFASRAQTHEARLQVDLAQLEYTYPRLTRLWSHLDTVTGGAAVGGVGTRGTGEKQLEIDRRLVQKRVASLKRQLKEIDKRKQREVFARSDRFLVSLVGYTNAGKSTLMNIATGSDTFVKDQLFATLDTKTTRWNLGQDVYCLLSDTVGFVRNLPHHLVASFRATLEEAIHANLLLHVVDMSHSQAEQQLAATNTVLRELGCGEKDILLVFNKIDRTTVSRRETMATLYPDAVFLSARTGEGMEELVREVRSRVVGQNLHLRITCSYSDGRVASFIRSHGTVLSEEYCEHGIVLEAFLGRRQLPSLQKLQPVAYEELTPAAS
ncbi:MAG: GTPase HflX [Sedimentisphaerales bacterium]|nr:GTPase HflX [Sedimentisphaerales bacterium]